MQFGTNVTIGKAIMKLFSVIFMACLLVVTTGAYAAEKEKKSSTKKQFELSGQVFVVTKGRENIKLALVEISVIAEKDVNQYLKARHIEGLHQQEILGPEVEPTIQAAKDADNAERDANRKWVDSLGKSDSANLEKLFWAARENEEKAKAKQRALIAKFEYYDSAAYYFEKLPAAIAVTKTDADGKFSLSLSPGKYVIAATSDRKLFNKSESYYWLVSVDTKSPSHSLMLTNDNQVETKCSECVRLE